MTANRKPELPVLARMAGENHPFTILGAVVPKGAPMRALLQVKEENERLKTALERIDSIANGISTLKDEQALSAYASLVRCGSIARDQLNPARR